MKKTPAFIENRILWRLGEHGGASMKIWMYKELSAEEKSFYRDKMGDKDIGNPVLIFIGEKAKWTILGTSGIGVGSDFETEVETMQICDIDTLQPVGGLHSSPPRKKGEWHELIATSHSGTKLILQAERGRDFFALWNILLVLVRMLQKEKQDI